MTKEEKQLLLKDLCARLRYGVKCYPVITNGEPNIIGGYCEIFDDFYIREVGGWFNISMIKPYLRPMSSMTEEERKEYMNKNVLDNCDEMNNIQEHYKELRNYPKNQVDEYYHQYIQLPRVHAEDYLNSIHVDYRGLIPKGLALEAPKDMYK